jgi:hypothetical protein
MGAFFHSSYPLRKGVLSTFREKASGDKTGDVEQFPFDLNSLAWPEYSHKYI